MKIPFLIITFALITNLGLSQKLPNVQQIGMRAPANVKIDGKANEWGEMKAYNKTARVFYTIANDDDKLYLSLQVRDYLNAQKVVKGGITITVNVSGSRKNKDDPSVTFPIYDKTEPLKTVFYKLPPNMSIGGVESKLYLDSLSKVRNQQLSEWLKLIGLTGMKGITEREISLYNEEDVKAALRFDSDLNCVYELAIPLKYLGLNITDHTKFAYQIKLNGAAANGTNIRDLREGKFFAWEDADRKTRTARVDDADEIYPTDFWGKYEIIK